MAKWFYYDDKGAKIGPVDGDKIKKLAKSGVITPETVIESEGGKQAPAGKVKGLEFCTKESLWYTYTINGERKGPIPTTVLRQHFGLIIQENRILKSPFYADLTPRDVIVTNEETGITGVAHTFFELFSDGLSSADVIAQRNKATDEWFQKHPVISCSFSIAILCGVIAIGYFLWTMLIAQ